jgi:hypothetical protein
MRKALGTKSAKSSILWWVFPPLFCTLQMRNCSCADLSLHVKIKKRRKKREGIKWNQNWCRLCWVTFSLLSWCLDQYVLLFTQCTTRPFPTHGYWRMNKRITQRRAGKKLPKLSVWTCSHISWFKLEGGWGVGVRVFTYMWLCGYRDTLCTLSLIVSLHNCTVNKPP